MEVRFAACVVNLKTHINYMVANKTNNSSVQQSFWSTTTYID